MENGFAVRGVVGILTGKEPVDDVFHLGIAEYLAVRACGTL